MHSKTAAVSATGDLAANQYLFRSHNSVLAVASRTTVSGFLKRGLILSRVNQKFLSQARAATRHLMGPVYTFCHAGRFKKSPWMTGTYGHYDVLLDFIRGKKWALSEGNFYVPFSNGYETGARGPEPLEEELCYVTTDDDFFFDFGIDFSVLHQLALRAGKHV